MPICRIRVSIFFQFLFNRKRKGIPAAAWVTSSYCFSFFYWFTFPFFLLFSLYRGVVQMVERGVWGAKALGFKSLHFDQYLSILFNISVFLSFLLKSSKIKFLLLFFLCGKTLSLLPKFYSYNMEIWSWEISQKIFTTHYSGGIFRRENKRKKGKLKEK